MTETIRQVVFPAGGAKPIAPYSPGIRTEGLLFASGAIGVEPDSGKLVEGGTQSETRQALQNLSAVLEAGGSSLQQVVKTTVFLMDLDKFDQMNQAYADFFPSDPPARSAVQVARLPGGASVEIEAIALVSE